MNTPTPVAPAARMQRFTRTSTLFTHLTPETLDHLTNALPQLIPGATATRGISSLLVHHPHDTPTLTLTELLTHATTTPSPAGHPSHTTPVVHAVPVTYHGEDLPLTARLLNTTVDELIHAHTHTLWQVHAMGFAPGFAYLTPHPDTPPTWRQWWQSIPRHDTPRPQVPAGSVAVAAGYSSIYPQRMPGGWHLLGTTRTPLFDSDNPHDPTLLHPGEHVHFTKAHP